LTDFQNDRVSPSDLTDDDGLITFFSKAIFIFIFFPVFIIFDHA